uniref:Protein kinase domain-containing protein n=1 Tax=Globodera rostochiensis TaxID=31243 RepID=A0A914HB65_GLORO
MYRPPDVLLGSTVYSTPLDMWGVGCIFAEMCIGCALFPGASDALDQLDRIFAVRGTPSAQHWPEALQLPKWDQFQLDVYAELEWADVDIKLVFKLNDQGRDLLTQLLKLPPRERISAAGAMLHKYFDELPKTLHALSPTESVLIAFNGNKKLSALAADDDRRTCYILLNALKQERQRQMAFNPAGSQENPDGSRKISAKFVLNMRMAYPSGGEGLCSPEIEISEGGTMLDGKGKFNDLKAMLDSNRENVKMDAMRRIINMVARGKDVSEMFPAVVKNVAAKNLELKKLVYVYLVRALKDPNQLIRASALRVLSSIRVQMISPVVMLAIREAIRDMSPYVRKVAAHAIPKLFALDHELQPQLIECIDNLLETCPDRLDLLHRHFRLFCRALADVDEWGQVVMIGLLTRYARTQFTSPFTSYAIGNRKAGTISKKRETDSSADEEDNDGDEEEHSKPLDCDHNLLIASVRPLLQSRNPAVVMAVAQLFFHVAPHAQLAAVPRALVRLLRGPNEVQYVVLVNIATICATRQTEELFAISKSLFEPFLKSFFVRNSDTIHVKRLKLYVLTSLVSEANVQLVVRELQAYLQMLDIAEAAIDTIGRCALAVPSAAETCLGCLIRLITTSGQDHIICASVVVLKRLLHADAPMALLRRMFQLINTVKAPMARSCILWLIGTHINKVPKLAPDLLRIVAKTFCEEADSVKLQSLNLAMRIWAIDPANREGKCAILVKYVFQLARYDRSYDIRDRCRFLRNFLFLNKDANSIVFPLDMFLHERPAPVVHNSFADRAEHFQLGTLSHLLNQKCTGYTELPDFPSQQPDPTVRRSAYPLPSDDFEAVQGKETTVTNAEAIDEEEEEAEEYSSEEGNEEEEEDGDEDEEEADEQSEEEVEGGFATF